MFSGFRAALLLRRTGPLAPPQARGWRSPHASAREERCVLAHIEARLRVTLRVENAFEAIEPVRLEAQDPLVIAQPERRQCRTLDVRVLAEAVAPVFGHDARTLLCLEKVPIVRSDERVDHQPIARRHAAEACGHVATVEFRRSVKPHTRPNGL